jgi:hypothetical protein
VSAYNVDHGCVTLPSQVVLRADAPPPHLHTSPAPPPHLHTLYRRACGADTSPSSLFACMEFDRNGQCNLHYCYQRYICVYHVIDYIEIFFGAVWLRPLTNLEVPHGAGACTLELCRFIWYGEYRSAVKVSTCNTTPPPKKINLLGCRIFVDLSAGKCVHWC